jgi:hypothetical protein
LWGFNEQVLFVYRLDIGFFADDFRLEADWTAIVADASRLPERKRQQQTAIWELIQTEAAYIETIEVITKVCSSDFLISLQSPFQSKQK